MTKPNLKIVKNEPSPTKETAYNSDKGRKQIERAKSRLMTETIRFVIEGATQQSGNRLPDRIRIASDLSGIPRVLIEAEIKQ